MEDISCGACGQQVIPWTRDRRMTFCKRCNMWRCGRCGGIVGTRMRELSLERILEWLIPKRILEWIIVASKNEWHCDQCGRKRTLVPVQIGFLDNWIEPALESIL